MSKPTWNRLGDKPLTPAERQRRYKIKKYAEYETLPKIVCACGCGTLIRPMNKQGKTARYAHGHNPDGIPTRFSKKHKPWNKKVKSGLIYPNHNKGKKLTKEQLEKRKITRLKNNGGTYCIKSGWKQKPLTIALMTKVNKEKALIGEASPRWLGGKSFEEYGKEFTPELKQIVLVRDNHKCTKCGMGYRKGYLLVHHRDTNKKNNHIDNLETLCRACHSRLHGTYISSNVIP